MGNSFCASETLPQLQKGQKIEENDTNITFEVDYTLGNNLEAKNAKNAQLIKIKTLGVLNGSKQLKFGFQNSLNRSSAKQRIRNNPACERISEEKTSRRPLEPIVFSIIDFSVSSDRSNLSESENGKWMSSQHVNKLLSSTNEDDGDDTNSQKATLEYLLTFVDHSPHVDVHKEQFIRIKKSNIENDYQFNQKMGEGSFGQVYKCTLKSSQQLRAVKLLKKNLLINPRVKQQFLQEFSILKKVDHPNILKIYEIYQTKNSLSIVSQFCQGNTLASYIKKKVIFKPETKMEILRQLFLGVNYLHHVSIVHRDLKPDNIVFVNVLSETSAPEDVDLRIIDFGLAVEHKEAIFKDWTNIGTYNFMAPEVFEGIYSNKCDSWACGVIMYLLLLGFNPYRGFQANQIKKNIRRYSPSLNDFKDMPLSAIDLLLNLTKVNYILRWDIDQALKCQFFTQTEMNFNRKDIFARLSSYRAVNGLVSVTESYLAFKKMSQDEQNKLAKCFHYINSNKNGTINLDELQKFFQGFDKEEVSRYFRKIDKNHSGAVDFQEFLVAMSNRKQLFSRQNLKEVFDVIDVNKKGRVTKEQFKYFLRSLDKATVDGLISQISQSKSNFITFEEFQKYLLKQKGF